MSNRGVKDFLGKPAPAGYIAGMGRGATGFVTRPDLGTGTNLASTTPLPPSATVTAAGIIRTEEDSFLDNENDEGLLAASGPLGAEDEEADAIFARIEAHLAGRRRKRVPPSSSAAPTPPNATIEEKSFRDPSVLFSSEKLQLRQVSMDEWAKLPESGDFIAKRAKKTNEKERYTPLPDSILMDSFGGGMDAAVSAAEAKLSAGVFEGGADFRMAGETRGKVLGARLDMTINSNASGVAVDPQRYLSQLDGEEAASAIQAADLRRAKVLLKNAVQANPGNPPVWISYAKVDEAAGDLAGARRTIAEAIEACPNSEEIWTEAVRLATAAERHSLIEKALQRLPNTPSLWLRAVEYQNDVTSAKRLLRKSLEENPDCVVLWKALIEREEDGEDARVLLAKAVECCPNAIELWVGLARLECHENARKIINKARQLNPDSVEIWFAAAKLEEAHGGEDLDLIQQIMNRALREMSPKMVFNEWLELAAKCEGSGDIMTCKATVLAACDLYLSNEKLLEIAEEFAKVTEGRRRTLRFLFEYILSKIPTEERVWLAYLKTIDPSFSAERNNILNDAVRSCRQSKTFWIALVESNRDVVETRVHFEAALEALPTDEDIWIAYSDFELRQGNYNDILQKLYTLKNPSAKVINQQIRINRLLGNKAGALELASKAVKQFPTDESCWLEYCNLHGSKWDQGIAACAKSVNLRIAAASSLAEAAPMRARAILEQSRKVAPDNILSWLASIDLEKAISKTPVTVKALLEAALRTHPKEAELWLMAIDMEPRPLRKAKAMEAFRRCGDTHPLILARIAAIMEEDRNLVAARDFYEKATTRSNTPNLYALPWAMYLKFVKKHDVDAVNVVEGRIREMRPSLGFSWKQFAQADAWWNADHFTIFCSYLESLSI